MQLKASHLFALLSILLSFHSNAQTIAWGTSSGTDLNVLQSNSTVTYKFTNINTALSNASFSVQLGTGIEYVAGTLVYTSSGSAIVTETAITGDNLATFTIGSIAINEIVEITFSRQASCSARAHKIATGSFSDIAHLYEGATEVTYVNNGGNPNEIIYDVTYANIVLSAPTHLPSSATSVGETVTRSVNITNGSFGSIDQFWFQDNYDTTNIILSNFEINGVTIDPLKIEDTLGIITINFDPITITNVDGSAGTNGDGDALFEKDEFFTLSYDAFLIQCGSGSYLSDIYAFYGEDINTPCNPSGSNSTSLSITNGTPGISLTNDTNPNIDLCGSTTHIVNISNSGTDPEDFAKDVVLFIGLRSNNSPIATLANVSMWSTERQGTKNFSNFTLNGNPIQVDSILGHFSNEVDYIPFDYFDEDPDGIGVGLEDLDGDGYFDDLGPGQSVLIGFDMTLTPDDNTCSTGRKDYIHWEHISVDANWSNQCGDLQAPKRSEISYKNIIRNYNQSTFLDGPSDINNGDLFEVRINPHFHTTVNCDGENGATGSDVSWTVKCILPAGVSLQAGATTDAHHSTYSPSIWQSNDTVFYNISRYNRDWFTFPLEMDCALWDNTKPIPFDFITTYECGTCWEQDIHCETLYSVPHCPSPCTGIVTTDFEVQRTTAGWTNNTQSEQVTLTEGTHALDKILPFDTIQMISTGFISDTTSDNLHLRIEYTPEHGDNIFEYVDGQIIIFDLDGTHGSVANTFPITIAPNVDTIVNAGDDTYNWDFDLSNFISSIDPSYHLGEGMDADSFTVVINGIYNSNPGYALYNVNTFRSNFYMIDINMVENSCDSYGTQMAYTGFGGGTGGNVVSLDGCGESEMFGYFTWYNLAGNIFPNEYRPIQQIDSIIIEMPAGVKFAGASSSGSISGTTGHYVKANGDVVVYPTGTYKPNQWGSTHSPRMDVHVKSDCSLESGIHTSNLEIYRTVYNYHPNSALHQQVYSTESNEPVISYVKPNLSAIPLNQVQNGIVDSVSWNIQVCNSTSGLDVAYNWLVLDNSASTGISVRRVLDQNGLEISTSDFGAGKLFVPIDTIEGGACSTITVIADYTSCSPDDLAVDFGWDCDAYPSDATELPDCGDPTFVRVIPLDASISAAITNLALTPSDPAAPATGNFGSSMISMCDEFPVEYRIISSSNAAMYDINFDVLIPNAGAGLTYVPNSATIEVEGVDAPNTPRQIDAAGEAALVAGTSGAFNIALSEIDATNFGASEGLAGAGTDPTQNEVIIRFLMQSNCTFTSGRRLKVQTYGTSFCGNVASGNGEIVNSSSLAVTGSTVPYIASFNSSISPNNTFNGCSDVKTLSIDVNIVGGPTTANDTLFATLYQGIEYNGNFNCTSTSCPTFIGTRMENGNQVVMFNYPSGIVDEMVSIDFEIGTDANNLCGDISYELTSVAEIAGLFCSSTGTTCPMTTIVTGSNSGIVTLINPELAVTFNSLVKTSGVPNQFDYDITVANNGTIATDNAITISFYEYDAATDTITGAMLASTTTTAALASNGSEQIVGNFWILGEANDGLVAVIDRIATENCSCPELDEMDDNPTATSSFVLPVEVTYFEGVAYGCSVDLEWETQSEINHAFFRIEHSEDGERYSTIEVIEAAGNEYGSHTYKYTHKGLLENKNYYRLVQSDYDGSITYFPVIFINTNCRDEQEIMVYPNPIAKDAGELTIKYFTQQRAVEIEIIDLYGNVIKSVELERYLGFNTSKVDINDLASGTYFIREKEGKMVSRFVILE